MLNKIKAWWICVKLWQLRVEVKAVNQDIKHIQWYIDSAQGFDDNELIESARKELRSEQDYRYQLKKKIDKLNSKLEKVK